MKLHCGWYHRKVSWHFLHCIIHILFLNVKQFHLWLSIIQNLVQQHCCGNINSLTDKPVSPPLQCATYAIWGSFAMTGFKVFPGSSCKPLLKNFSAKKVKVITLFVLCAGPIIKKMYSGHIWEFSSDFLQNGLHVFPYCRWSLQSWCWYGAEGGRGQFSPHMINTSV